jgi:transposase-like protein
MRRVGLKRRSSVGGDERKAEGDRRAVRTTDAVERRFGEVRRRTRPMGTFQDQTSMDRILLAVFTHENKSQGVSTPFLLTQNN